MRDSHKYLTSIDSEIYSDLVKIKGLDNRSINSLLQEGARMVRNKYVEQLTREVEIRSTLNSGSHVQTK